MYDTILIDIWKQELKMKEQRTRSYINYFLFPFISLKFCLLFIKFLETFSETPKEDSAITSKESALWGADVCGDRYSTLDLNPQLKLQEQKEASRLEIANLKGGPKLQH